MYFLVLLLFNFLMLTLCGAQQDNRLLIRRNQAYLEMWGAGGPGSLNYERTIFLSKGFCTNIRIGISSFPFLDFRRKFNPDLVFPTGFNALFGHAHQLELGYGAVLVSHVRMSTTDFRPARFHGLQAYGNIGYRFQPKAGRSVFRLCYTPVIDQYERFIHRAAISAGIRF